MPESIGRSDVIRIFELMRVCAANEGFVLAPAIKSSIVDAVEEIAGLTDEELLLAAHGIDQEVIFDHKLARDAEQHDGTPADKFTRILEHPPKEVEKEGVKQYALDMLRAMMAELRFRMAFKADEVRSDAQYQELCEDDEFQMAAALTFETMHAYTEDRRLAAEQAVVDPTIEAAAA